MDNLSEINKHSRSRSTYDQKRPTFSPKKKIQPIICLNEEQKTEEIQISPLISLYKQNEMSISPVLSLENSSSNEKLSFFLFFDKKIILKKKFKTENFEKINNGQNSIKMRNEIKLYNYLMLWVSIVSETCQKLTDDMKIPDSSNWI